MYLICIAVINIRKEIIKYSNCPVVVYPYVCVFHYHELYAIACFYSHVLCYSTYVYKIVKKLSKVIFVICLILSEACPQLLQAHA